VEADVKSALINLGYDERAAESAVHEAKREAGAKSFENLLRVSLASLSAPATQHSSAKR
jgi:Holliday junction resolvasome RuvABC DNA-binding subunit